MIRLSDDWLKRKLGGVYQLVPLILLHQLYILVFQLVELLLEFLIYVRDTTALPGDDIIHLDGRRSHARRVGQ